MFCPELLSFTSLIVNENFILVIGFLVLFTSFFDNIILPSLLDTAQGRVSVFTLGYFLLLFLVNTIIEFLLLFSALKMDLSINRARKPTFYHLLMTTVVIFLVSTIFVLCIQILENKSYSVLFLLFIVVYDLAVSTTIIAILVSKFSIWIKRRKNFYALLYVASFSIISVTLTSSAIGLVQELLSRPSPVTPLPNPWDNISTLKPVLYDVYRVGSLISFGLFWVGTSIFLKNYSNNYSKKIGKWKFWILVSLPMIYYVGTVDFILNYYVNALIFQYPDFTSVIFYLLGVTKQLGGFFFSLSFIFMSRKVDNVRLKYYLLLTAIGIMILYSSIQISTLHILPYPPFGVITLSLMPISSYLVLSGLYYSARSISQDKKFLAELRKQINNESNSFLNSIGSAEWNRTLEITIRDVLKEVGSEGEIDVDYTLEDNDVRSYVFNVIKELKKKKTRSS